MQPIQYLPEDKTYAFIIPTYDNVKYLNQCIESIVSQATEAGLDYEILLGIDACEKTLEHVKSNDLIKSSCRTFYFTENGGPYLIKNTLASLAKQKNIIFFDSDDVLGENFVRSTVDLMLTYDLVRWTVLNFTRPDMKDLVKMFSPSTGVFAIRRELFLKMNGFLPWRIAADSEFEYRCTKTKVNRINSRIEFYRRIHSTNLTVKEETGMMSKLRWSLKKKIDQFQIQNKFDNPEVLSIADYYEFK